MTALAGVWRFDGGPNPGADCRQMLNAQRIYGRDPEALWSSDDVSIGCRLTQTLPEDAFDHQPLIGAGGRYVLVADLRLDNRDELARSLRLPEAGRVSDAAMLLACFEHWGEASVERIVGDYAFALWDAAGRRLLLARDPLGQRPLHFHKTSRLFVFSSMPKGLHALGEIPRAPDEEKIAEFMVLMPDHGTRTFFAGIERVEPGHMLTVKNGRISVRRHWNPKRRSIRLNGPNEYAEALRTHLDEAVRSRLRGSSDVGVYMSGGLDSTAVAATSARLLGNSDRRVISFTAVPRRGFSGVVPRNRFVDEGAHAAAVAALYPNMDHVVVPTDGRSLLDSLDPAFVDAESPMLSPCNAAWGDSIRDAMRARGLSVALNGGFGNMGLSYDGIELLAELVRGGRWIEWVRVTRRLVKPGAMRWRGALALTLGPWCPEGIWNWLNRLANGHAPKVDDYTAIHPEKLKSLDLKARARARGLDFSYRPWKDGFEMRLWCLRRMDPGSTSKAILARYGIDERDPTADTRLLEFCLGVPTEQFLREGRQRALARAALSDRLPKLVLDETRSGFQTADWYESATADRERIAVELERLDHCAPAAATIDLGRLHKLVEDWPDDGWERDEVSEPYRLALLRGVAVGHFIRRATGSNA